MTPSEIENEIVKRITSVEWRSGGSKSEARSLIARYHDAILEEVMNFIGEEADMYGLRGDVDEANALEALKEKISVALLHPSEQKEEPKVRGISHTQMKKDLFKKRPDIKAAYESEDENKEDLTPSSTPI